MTITSINPTTGDVDAVIEPHDADEVSRLIGESVDAYAVMRATPLITRSEWMHRAADILEADLEQLATLITREMGKVIGQARSEVLKSASAMRFYADNAAEFIAPTPLSDPSTVGASAAYTSYHPIGPVLAVMPWNYPIWQVIRFAAPTLMAGNTGILKHASNVPRSAIYLGELFERAGFPRGAFHTLLIGASAVESVLRDPRITAVTLTGSEPAGRSVAATAGSEIKHVVLELGGSDPFIVMPSADLESAVGAAVTSRTMNNGQACIAAKRFIVHGEVYDAFVDAFTRGMSALTVGDPHDASTDVGPLATESVREELAELVDDAIAQGAVVGVGGVRPDRAGWFYPPTVLLGVTSEMRIYSEEAFGPVAVVHRVEDRVEAAALANDTRFGLSSAVWTSDPTDEEFFVNEVEAGAVFINGVSTSYAALPFGGVKDSGVGRELAAEGMREFCNLKTVWRA